ncbi:unnamed protein product [Rhizoctonia solani]|uniref:DUF6535 domain-containing protein n=1 Tax=Rhizoctonia solani TaxID=456999 RepID=A0A8H3CFM4_9AGAM|nr:unnamed protein product [Rhizoctonia solani]
MSEEMGDTASGSSSNKTNREALDLNSAAGYKLGRDDPFWPLYLEEAEKYDDMTIQKWDKKMETLLLFATLFSAIVTAFVIESHRSLQADNTAITAVAIVEIAGILRNGTRGDQRGSPVLDSLNNFQPSASAFIVNFAWFISLCLSITVALLAGLVKQWCNTLLSDRTAPPCNQARIRQARFNELRRWRTELVISALPVIMDAALGLFLLGLLVFLQDLSYIIFLAALIVTLLTGTFYFCTTVASCFISFCPYETAISSRKTWGFFYQVYMASVNWVGNNFRDVDHKKEVDLTKFNYMTPCEKKEVEMVSNTIPDRLTGDALNWIILHSQKQGPREMAIRAIATLDSEESLKQLVSDPPGILRQVIQSFTSCFAAHPSELPQMACALAILVLNLNHDTSYPLRPEYPNSQPRVLRERGRGKKFAKELMGHYAKKPASLAKDGQSLLLFALTGLMEYYEHCDFNDGAHQNMKKIAEQFQGFDSLGKLQPVEIPIATDDGELRMMPIDLRSYFVNILLVYLKLPRSLQHDQAIDEVLMHLLKSINTKRQSWGLEAYSPQIIPLVTQVLTQTKDAKLQIECLSFRPSYYKLSEIKTLP